MSSAPIPAGQGPSLFVSDIHPDVTEKEISDLFSSCGKVTSTKICRDAQSRVSLGYCYVNYETPQEAASALSSLNYHTIGTKGGKCRIMWAQRDPSGRRAGLGNLYVKNLSPNADAQALHELFAKLDVGLVTSAKVPRDAEGKSRGYGFVCFSTEEAANTAMEKLNNAEGPAETKIVAMKYIPAALRMSAEWTNCFVKNLPKEWTEDKLKTVFGKFGEITSAAIGVDAEGKSKGFGFCSFKNHKDAVAATEALNGKYAAQISEDGTVSDAPFEAPVEASGEPTVQPLAVCRHMKKSERARQAVGGYKAATAAKQDTKNLYVKGIPVSATDDDLRAKFVQYGTVTSAKVSRDASNISKGHGFVSFSSSDEANKALTALHHSMWEGRPLFVNIHQNRQDRDRQLADARNRTQTQNTTRVQQQQQQQVPMAGMMPQMMPNTFGPQQMNQMMMMFASMMSSMNQQQQQPHPMMAMAQPQANRALQAAPQGVRPQQQFQQPPQQQQQQRPAGPVVPQPQQQVPRPVAAAYSEVASRGAPIQQQPQQQQQQRPVPTRPVGQPNVVMTAQAANIPQQQQQAPQMPQRVAQASNPLLVLLSNAATDSDRKNILGERLFPQIQQIAGPAAGKITGMLLEMDVSDLIGLTEIPDQLYAKVNEAKEVLKSSNWAPA